MALQLPTCVVFHSQCSPQLSSDTNHCKYGSNSTGRLVVGGMCRGRGRFIGHLSCSSNAEKGVPNSNYVVPLDKTFSPSNSSCITRPLVEILRDLNKRIPENIINLPSSSSSSSSSTFLPWYHANRMLSFYAPGWCGEVRDVRFADDGTITVVYRLSIRGSDAEAHRESTGTVSSSDVNIADPVATAEEIAFCRACARFGLGLYLYHEE
ncbi:hypothetical protein HRI_000425300 [Hibiscus trionum]|uniref:Uncharacterized protein n=1 Tax=Hibiscus trionum TaxID=183268 RepID=A0A9W7GXX4_HIBTR|nr:hypothetical protein HRI_000425300 [Hibiscus trionum]